MSKNKTERDRLFKVKKGICLARSLSEGPPELELDIMLWRLCVAAVELDSGLDAEAAG